MVSGTRIKCPFPVACKWCSLGSMIQFILCFPLTKNAAPGPVVCLLSTRHSLLCADVTTKKWQSYFYDQFYDITFSQHINYQSCQSYLILNQCNSPELPNLLQSGRPACLPVAVLHGRTTDQAATQQQQLVTQSMYWRSKH